MTDLRKAATSAYNKSDIKQFNENWILGLLKHAIGRVVGTEKSFEEKQRERGKDDTVLHVSDSFLYGNPGSIAVDDIEALDAENA